MTLLDKLKWTLPELFARLGISLAELIAKLGLSAVQLLLEMFGAHWLADYLGVAGKIMGYIDDCLNAETFGIWGKVTSWADVTIGMVLDAAGVSDAVALLEQLGVTPLKVLEHIGLDPWEALLQMGYGMAVIIANILGKEIGDPFHIGAADEVPQRGVEIGQALGQKLDISGGRGGFVYPILLPYGIMALCEVWTGDLRDRIVAALGASGSQYTFTQGPDISGKSLSGSGLFQIVNNYPVLDGAQTVFSARGDQFADADYWANKGAMLTRIDVGLGIIDLFSTHLYWGGGLIDAWGLSDEERANLRRAQIDELAGFISQYHPADSPNIAILIGDFNIAGDFASQDITEYSGLRDRLEAIGLRDEWAVQRGGGRFGAAVDPAGYTDSARDEICKVPATADQSFCDDPLDPATVAGVKRRFDYFWVERPRAEHAFNLDVTRVRRRPFRRPDGQNYMSDHLGIDATLIFSPR